ncbi:MAG: DEAD/DEAH box helicase [Firmicutes bacterium]|nr:DEAD/DEAH box helicase [Bacillota bacterium]
MSFKKLEIIEPILRSLETEGYEVPTPIQLQSIPVLLSGKDVLGSAQTGTGKTAAFAIPILQNLTIEQQDVKSRRVIKALISTPTRELALQIKESFQVYGKHLKLKTIVVFGGVPQRSQTEAIRSGVDILVATPGRLLDLINQKIVHLDQVKYFVLDEADRMLDMGFIHDVKKIIAFIPTKRQTMLFSATMPKEISSLASSILIHPIRIAVVPVETTIDAIDQSVYFVTKKSKTKLLIHLLKSKDVTSALVFSRTKHGANKIVKDLLLEKVNAEAIHGNKSQSARQQALHLFKTNKIQVLVATDIAARGLDIEKLSHVFNYDLPEVPETYIHRIGRTGRAGLEGKAISFCSEEELPLLKDIQRHIKKQLPVIKDHPYIVVFSDTPLKQVIKNVPQHSQIPKNYSKHDSKNRRYKPSETSKKNISK